MKSRLVKYKATFFLIDKQEESGREHNLGSVTFLHLEDSKICPEAKAFKICNPTQRTANRLKLEVIGS